MRIGSACGGPAVEWDTPRNVATLTKYLERRVKIFARFRAAQNGTTAVEFALIAPAFLAMIFAIFLTTIFLFAQQTLQNAAVQAGRMFMTGSAQTGDLTQAKFSSDVGPMISALFNCNNLQIDMAVYSSFSSAGIAAPTPNNSQGQLRTSGAYRTEMIGVTAFRVEPY
jgi:Flp pilus assembly protein TadG